MVRKYLYFCLRFSLAHLAIRSIAVCFARAINAAKLYREIFIHFYCELLVFFLKWNCCTMFCKRTPCTCTHSNPCTQNVVVTVSSGSLLLFIMIIIDFNGLYDCVCVLTVLLLLSPLSLIHLNSSHLRIRKSHKHRYLYTALTCAICRTITQFNHLHRLNQHQIAYISICLESFTNVKWCGCCNFASVQF